MSKLRFLKQRVPQKYESLLYTVPEVTRRSELRIGCPQGDIHNDKANMKILTLFRRRCISDVMFKTLSYVLVIPHGLLHVQFAGND